MQISDPSKFRSFLQMLSLSDAVISYTAYCDQLSQLGQLVERVAHKHVSFGVKSEHYPVVGRALLQALEVGLTLKSVQSVKSIA